MKNRLNILYVSIMVIVSFFIGFLYNNKNEDDCTTIIKSKYVVTWKFKENETITLKHNSIIIDLNNSLIDKLPSSTEDYSYYKLLKGEYILIKDGFSFEERIILLKIE